MITDKDDSLGLIRTIRPQTSGDALNTYIWYHPQLSKTSGSGPKKWGSQIWGILWKGGVQVLSDTWDPLEQQPILQTNFTLTAKEAERARKAINTLINSLPEPWESLLERRAQ